jgi:hypothetical protein
MADAVTLCKNPAEDMRSFNGRLRQECSSRPVTNFDLMVVDGQPVVALLCEEVEATEEDAQDALSEDPDSDLKVGDWIPAADPLVVQVSRVSCISEEQADKTEQRLDQIYDRAGGNVIRHIPASGQTYSWIPDVGTIPIDPTTGAPKEGALPTKYLYAPVSASFIAVAFLAAEEEEADDKGAAKAEAGVDVERNLRRAPKARAAEDV